MVCCSVMVACGSSSSKEDPEGKPKVTPSATPLQDLPSEPGKLQLLEVSTKVLMQDNLIKETLALCQKGGNRYNLNAQACVCTKEDGWIRDERLFFNANLAALHPEVYWSSGNRTFHT